MMYRSRSPVLALPTTRFRWNGPYGIPRSWQRLPNIGMQDARLSQPMRPATCEEVSCTWFMFGHEGEDEGAPFVHPAGVRCGDFKNCWHPNCPCPARARSHRVPAEQYPLKYQVATNAGVRPVSNDEWRYRVAEGIDAAHHLKTRGI